MHVFCRFVSDGFRNIHITMLLSNIDQSASCKFFILLITVTVLHMVQT